VLASAYTGWAGSLLPEAVDERWRKGLRDSNLPPEQVVESWISTMQKNSEQRLVVVSKRLSVSLEKTKVEYKPSVGALATGMSSLCRQCEKIWFGWPGRAAGELDVSQWECIHTDLRERYDAEPVKLSQQDLDEFYYGFCNNTIWPLFHYFPTYANYNPVLWEAYRRVNLRYAEKIEEVGKNGDVFWIHDYHLMLLPRLVKKRFPDSRVGVFLHLPFPCFELFRLLQRAPEPDHRLPHGHRL
jgi:trehalose 6-phosphate synthase/phosphatase